MNEGEMNDRLNELMLVLIECNYFHSSIYFQNA